MTIKKKFEFVLISYPDVVDSEETRLSTMSSTDFAARGPPASSPEPPEAAEAAPPSHEGRRGMGDSKHLELDLEERKTCETIFDAAKEGKENVIFDKEKMKVLKQRNNEQTGQEI